MMRSTINPHNKNGRTRTAAEGRSRMERCIPLKAADFKAGVAVPSQTGDVDVNLTHGNSRACGSMGADRNGERAAQPGWHEALNDCDAPLVRIDCWGLAIAPALTCLPPTRLI